MGQIVFDLFDGMGRIGIGDARHQQAQFLFIGLAGVADAHDLTVEHDSHPVAECENLFQLDRDQQDRFALIAQGRRSARG